MSCDKNCSNCGDCHSKVENNFFGKYDRFEYGEHYKHPYTAIMSITDACTNACPYCFVRFGKRKMSLPTARKAVEWLRENGKYHNTQPGIAFFGGEPLLEFESIIVPIVEENPDFQFSITTNGVLLTAEKVDFLKQHGVAVLLSLDGDKITQDMGRPLVNGESSFDIIEKNLPYIVQELGPNVTMRSTITKQNIPYLYDNFLFAIKTGFSSWSFAIDTYEEYSQEDKNLLIKELEKISKDICFAIQSGKPIPIVTPFTTFFRSLQNNEVNPSYEINNDLFRCGMATTGTGIDCDGNIVPCQEKNSKPEFAVGNIFTGIDGQKHEAYLKRYFDTMKEYHCDFPCKDGLKSICLNDICPSRLIDFNYRTTPLSGTCILNQALFKVVSRLYLKFGWSANNYAKIYFATPQQREDWFYGNESKC